MSKAVTAREQRKFQKVRLPQALTRCTGSILSRSKLYIAIYEAGYEMMLTLYQLRHTGHYQIRCRFTWLLGNVKAEQHKDRLYNKNQSYQHIDKCQSYKAYESGEATLWKRRVAFQKSIEFLEKQAEHGAEQARAGCRFTVRSLNCWRR